MQYLIRLCNLSIKRLFKLNNFISTSNIKILNLMTLNCKDLKIKVKIQKVGLSNSKLENLRSGKFKIEDLK